MDGYVLGLYDVLLESRLQQRRDGADGLVVSKDRTFGGVRYTVSVYGVHNGSQIIWHDPGPRRMRGAAAASCGAVACPNREGIDFGSLGRLHA